MSPFNTTVLTLIMITLVTKITHSQLCCDCMNTGPAWGSWSCKISTPVNACQNKICVIGDSRFTNNPDPYCCTTWWDAICASEASTICNADTPSPTAAGPVPAPTHRPTFIFEKCIDEYPLFGGEGWLSIDTDHIGKKFLMKIHGPANKWFGVGFGKHTMDNTYAIITSDSVLATKERLLANHAMGNEQTSSFLQFASSEINGKREIQFIRDYNNIFDFNDWFDCNNGNGWLNIISALGSGLSFSQHAAKFNTDSLWSCLCPTDAPTGNPTSDPSVDPTNDPTNDPTSDPTKTPTTDPTYHPTTDPTVVPTKAPTADPTIHPTHDPSMDPTTVPTGAPSNDPTSDPTADPTTDPTNDPTHDPTSDPTVDPTSDPTSHPTTDPTTSSPTSDPTQIPTLDPTFTHNPTEDPTMSSNAPSTDPTADPTIDPTSDPTDVPTSDPTSVPTTDPTIQPTRSPIKPTLYTTNDPTTDPTSDPTNKPTYYTSHPSVYPTRSPIGGYPETTKKDTTTTDLANGGHTAIEKKTKITLVLGVNIIWFSLALIIPCLCCICCIIMLLWYNKKRKSRDNIKKYHHNSPVKKLNQTEMAMKHQSIDEINIDDDDDTDKSNEDNTNTMPLSVAKEKSTNHGMGNKTVMALIDVVKDKDKYIKNDGIDIIIREDEEYEGGIEETDPLDLLNTNSLNVHKHKQAMYNTMIINASPPKHFKTTLIHSSPPGSRSVSRPGSRAGSRPSSPSKKYHGMMKDDPFIDKMMDEMEESATMNQSEIGSFEPTQTATMNVMKTNKSKTYSYDPKLQLTYSIDSVKL